MTASITAITMPKWGLTMTEGKIVRWSRQPGTSFAPGDELLEIETSKITNVVEAETSGTLARVVVAEGATVPVGALLAIVAPAGTPPTEIDAFVSGFAVIEPTAGASDETPGPQPREVAAGGKRLRYLEHGNRDGVPVLLLHGFGGDLNTWMFNQPALAESSRTIALELPGHGGSTKDVGAGDARALTDAAEAALAALEIERVHLVGHSMGGAIVALLAARHPERIATLTMIAPAGLGPEINGAFIDDFVHASRRKDVAEVLKPLVHDPSLVSRIMVEEVLRYKRLDGVTAALETIAQAWFPAGRQAVSIVPEVARLDLPVQVIWGNDDRIVPASHADALASHAQVHRLGNTGHLPHMEIAGEVNRLIRRFIEGQPTRR